MVLLQLYTHSIISTTLLESRNCLYSFFQTGNVLRKLNNLFVLSPTRINPNLRNWLVDDDQMTCNLWCNLMLCYQQIKEIKVRPHHLKFIILDLYRIRSSCHSGKFLRKFLPCLLKRFTIPNNMGQRQCWWWWNHSLIHLFTTLFIVNSTFRFQIPMNNHHLWFIACTWCCRFCPI